MIKRSDCRNIISLMKTGGLTFIELVISVTLIAILVVTSMPLAENIIIRAKEQELKQALIEIRQAIDRYYEAAHKENPEKDETEKYPSSLEELVARHFLRKIPVDPLTGRADWRTISSTDPPDTFVTNGENVFDVRSRSLGTGSNKVPYYLW